jgi:hypothetical protein
VKLPGYKAYKREYHVGEETYSLRFVAKIPGESSETLGLCDPESRVIYVKKGLSKAMLFRTVTHELIHALEFEYELPIKHSLVYQLERALVDMLLMNF